MGPFAQSYGQWDATLPTAFWDFARATKEVAWFLLLVSSFLCSSALAQGHVQQNRGSAICSLLQQNGTQSLSRPKGASQPTLSRSLKGPRRRACVASRRASTGDLFWQL